MKLECSLGREMVMNKNQKLVILVCIGVAILMLLFPPFKVHRLKPTRELLKLKVGLHAPYENFHEVTVFRPLFNEEGNLHFPTLTFQWIGVILVGGVLFFVFGREGAENLVEKASINHGPFRTECPNCDQAVMREANVCKNCHFDLAEWREQEEGKVDDGHENLKPSDMLATAYFYRKKGNESKASAYLFMLYDRHPNSDEGGIALKEIEQEMRRCPQCYEVIRKLSVSCIHCGNEFTDE